MFKKLSRKSFSHNKYIIKVGKIVLFHTYGVMEFYFIQDFVPLSQIVILFLYCAKLFFFGLLLFYVQNLMYNCRVDCCTYGVSFESTDGLVSRAVKTLNFKNQLTLRSNLLQTFSE